MGNFPLYREFVLFMSETKVDKNISGEFLCFSEKKKFFVVVFVYEWREHVFLLFIFSHWCRGEMCDKTQMILPSWDLEGTCASLFRLEAPSIFSTLTRWLMLFNLFVFLQVVVQSVTDSVVLRLCHINPAASRFYTTSRGTLSSVTHVLLFVVFRRRLCDSHKHPNNVGKYSSRPRRMFYDLGVQTCDRTTETQPELSVSSSHLHLLHSRVFVSWIISHDYNEQENEDRRGRTVSFHPWQTSRCVK